MNIMKTLVISMLLTSGFVIAAESVPMTKTFEVSATSLRLPATPNGTISLRECEDCDYHSIRTTSQTSYGINGKSYSLADFKLMLQTMKLHAEVFVNVKRDDASNTVATVFVYSD